MPDVIKAGLPRDSGTETFGFGLDYPMDNQSSQATPRALWRHIIGYSMGHGALALTLNGIYTYAMLYYTQARGLPFAQAGVAFSVASLWDAVFDPALGHISDNTRTRWGRRHPFILGGGLLMAAAFYAVWAVPDFVLRGGYLVPYFIFINILYRTAFAIFSIPFVALGFEICTDYLQRSQLQGTGMVVSMLTSVLGPGLAWMIFFPDHARGGREATSVASNFIHMGTVFAIASVGFTVVVILATRRYMGNGCGVAAAPRSSLAAIYRNSGRIIANRYLRPVIIFFCVGLTGQIFVSMVQGYLFVYFMHLTAFEKTILTGGGMILCGVGAIVAAPLARRFDKKHTVCIGAAISSLSCLTAAILFLGGVLEPGTTWIAGGHVVPIAVIVYGACSVLYLFGSGIYQSTAWSMVADVAEANELRSGIRQDGGHAAVFAFSYKMVISTGTLLASACLAWVGFVNGRDQQTPQALHGLLFLGFGLGSLFAFLVIPIVWRYPITREFMAKVKGDLALKARLRVEEAGLP